MTSPVPSPSPEAVEALYWQIMDANADPPEDVEMTPFENGLIEAYKIDFSRYAEAVAELRDLPDNVGDGGIGPLFGAGWAAAMKQVRAILDKLAGGK